MPEQLNALAEAVRQRSAAARLCHVDQRAWFREVAGGAWQSGRSAGGAHRLGAIVVLRQHRDRAGGQPLRVETAQAQADFAALAGLIEAAPLPMWFRGTDARCGWSTPPMSARWGRKTPEVVAEGIELVERIEGLSPPKWPRGLGAGPPIERVVASTINGQRRTMRVSDLPLGEGVAGYAVDIEEMEELTRQFRAFREAQRRCSICCLRASRSSTRSAIWFRQPAVPAHLRPAQRRYAGRSFRARARCRPRHRPRARSARFSRLAPRSCRLVRPECRAG
jgi:hypothetical protein